MDKILWESQDDTLRFDFLADGTDFCEVDPNSLLFRRLQHYRQWCLTHQTEYRYLQIVSDWIDGVKHTFSRPVWLQPKPSNAVQVTLNPWVPHPHPSLQFSIANGVIDSVSDGLLVAETESIGGGSNITFVNTALAKLSGYAKEALRGQTLEEFYAGTTDVEALLALKDARDNFETRTVVLKQNRKDGSSYLARITQSALADETGWHTHFVSTHVDITREEAERRIETRQRHLGQRMQKMAKTGWWRLKLDSQEFECDEGMRAIAEVDDRDPKSVDVLKYVVTTDQSRVVDVINKCHATGHQSTTEVRIITGKQRTKWLRIHVEPDDYKDGQVHSVLGTTIDITDVIESERTRHEQHDELEFYLNCLDEHSLVMKLDAGLCVAFGNEPLFDCLEYKRQEIYGRQIEELMLQGDAIDQGFYDAIYQGDTWRGEWVQQAKGGSPRVLDVFASPRLDAKNQLKEVFIFLYDISSRKLSDEISQLAATVRAEPADANILQRGIEHLVRVSGSEAGVLYFGKDHVVFPLDSSVSDKPAELRIPYGKDELSDGALVLNGRMGGYPVDFQFIIRPLLDAVIDAECHRRDEMQRQQEAFKNRYILETLKIGSWRYKIKEKQWYFSEELFALLQAPAPASGVAPRELVDQRIPQLEQTKLLKSMREMLRADENFEVNVRINLPDKQRIYVKVQGRLIRNAKGVPEQIVGIASDVTEERRMQRELENQKSLASHQARLASIGELAAGVGHEINNPLTIIRGFLDITKNHLLSGELNEETVLDLIAKMDDSATRIGKIVEGLRSLSHADVIGEVFFHPEVILHNTVGFVEEIYRRQGIDITMSTSVPADLRMKGYEGKLQQVVMNLLSNARDATEGQTTRKINASAYIEHAALMISIEDNGPGVAPSIKDRIFHPFFTTKEIGKGTGIGLSMVFSVVQEFNGSVVCETGALGGAKFLVRLPLSEVVKPQVIEETPKAETSNTVLAGRVLIVDDEPDVREFLMLMLGQMGLVADTAANGQQALEVFFDAPKPYDLIITDLTMPVMGGFEFLDQVQLRNAKEDNPRAVSALLSTGLPDFSFDAERYPMIIGLLNKPFNLALLRKRLLAAGLGVAPDTKQERGLETGKVVR